MKPVKLLVLLSAFALVACGTTANQSTSINGDSTSVEDTSASADNSSNEESSNSQETSASTSESSSSSTTSTSSQEDEGESISFNFYNPTCGSAGTDSLDETLKTYMNGIAGTSLVSAVSNTSCQIMANAPSNGNNRLTIGASKYAGELEITFTSTIKSVVIEAETYYKYYDGANHPDAGSTCYVNVDTNKIDLSVTGTEPIVKTETFAVNGKKVKLYNKAANNRAYIKTITLKF